MRKFRITSDNFKGEMQIAFNANGVINLVDTTMTEFTASNMDRLFEILPKALGENPKQTLHKLSINSAFKIVEIFGDISFDKFWNTYGHKVNRQRCIKLWDKLDDASKSLAILRIAAYKRYLSWQSWRKIMDPEKWLRDRQFETEWHSLTH